MNAVSVLIVMNAITSRIFAASTIFSKTSSVLGA
jgi:hypothetical protein